MKEKLVRTLNAGGLPPDALGDCARVTLAGRLSVTVEGQHGIVELSDEQIRLRTGDGILRVCGSGLHLRALSAEQAVIAGETIDTVSYRSDAAMGGKGERR